MTDTDICNMALSNIGKGVIENMEEGVENARACKLFYDPTRREVLRSFPWGFAHRIERLAVVDVDVPGWDFAYFLNCLLGRYRGKSPGRLVAFFLNCLLGRYQYYIIR